MKRSSPAFSEKKKPCEVLGTTAFKLQVDEQMMIDIF